MTENQNTKEEPEEEQDRKLNQQATMEKLKTPKNDVKKLKTLDELLKDKR